MKLIVLAVVLAMADPAAAAAAPSEQDKNFLIAAHQANLAEIETGRLARQNGTSPMVRQLGARIVADHIELDAKLLPVARELAVTLPTEPNEDQKTTQLLLDAASGAQFDQLWIDTERTAQREIMTACEIEISSGGEQAAKEIASSAEPVIAAHQDALAKAAVALSPPAKVDSGLGGFADTSPPGAMLAIVTVGMLLLVAGLALRRRERQ